MEVATGPIDNSESEVKPPQQSIVDKVSEIWLVDSKKIGDNIPLLFMDRRYPLGYTSIVSSLGDRYYKDDKTPFNPMETCVLDERYN